MEWQVILNWILNFFKNIGDFAYWLTADIEITSDITIAPIEIIGISGFGIMIAIWIIKLINPFS